MNISNSVVVKSPFNGIIFEIKVNENDNVVRGQVILIIESFNIYLKIPSPIYGNIQNIFVSVGQKIEKDQVLMNIDSL